MTSVLGFGFKDPSINQSRGDAWHKAKCLGESQSRSKGVRVIVTRIKAGGEWEGEGVWRRRG